MMKIPHILFPEWELIQMDDGRWFGMDLAARKIGPFNDWRDVHAVIVVKMTHPRESIVHQW